MTQPTTKPQPQDVFDCLAADIPREDWEEALKASAASSATHDHASSAPPPAPHLPAIFGEQAARVLALQMVQWVRDGLQRIDPWNTSDDEWPCDSAIVSGAFAIAVKEVPQVEAIIFEFPSDRFAIHAAFMNLAGLLECLFNSYTPKTNTYVGRVLLGLFNGIDAMCGLWEFVLLRSTAENEGGAV